MLFDELEDDTCVQPQSCEVIESRLEHILIIDDDFAQTEALGHRFRKIGYQVSIANSCADGISQARGSEKPDLILLDICMPDGDGLETCSKFNDDRQTRDIPVIIVSGLDDAEVVRNARSAGCHYFVRKPYDPNALLILAQNAILESKEW